jgi:hypothetical protein
LQLYDFYVIIKLVFSPSHDTEKSMAGSLLALGLLFIAGYLGYKSIPGTLHEGIPVMNVERTTLWAGAAQLYGSFELILGLKWTWSEVGWLTLASLVTFFATCWIRWWLCFPAKPMARRAARRQRKKAVSTVATEPNRAHIRAMEEMTV